MSTSRAILLFTVAFLMGAGVAAFILRPPFQAEVSAILLSGILGAGVAVWAIYSQRSITCRRATLDHIAFLNADRELIEGRVKFRELAKETGGLAPWAALDKEQTPEFQMIVNRLNEFELISIGIQRGIIDFELYARWFKSGALRAWEDAEPFITDLRRRLGNNNMLYHEFQEMVRWFAGGSRPPQRTWWWGKLF